MELSRVFTNVEGRREIPIEFALKWQTLFKLFFAGKCENTKKNYKEDLTKFVAFYYKAKKKYDPTQATHEDIVDFVTFLKRSRSKRGTPISNKTINRHVSTLRSFFKFLQRKGIVRENPATLIELPKIPLKVKAEYLTEDEVNRIFDSADDLTLLGARNLALLKMYFYSGCRNSEIRNIKFKNLYIDHSHPHFEVKVKGESESDSKNRISPDVLDDLKLYIVERGKKFGDFEEEDYLFHSLKCSTPGKKALSSVAIWKIFKKAVDNAGIEKNISPHSARTTLARMIYKKTRDVKATQEILGHKDIRMTTAYIKKFFDLENTIVGETGLYS